VGIARFKRRMLRLRITLRTTAVVVAMPVILLVMRDIPIGYTYWVQYQAPVMLDEIVVHHDE
jgi:hypothetical protein